MGTLLYFIKETFRGFVQAKLMTFVSIVTIAITLFFLGCIIVGVMNARLWLSNTSKKANIVVYLEDDLYEDTVKCNELIKEVDCLKRWILFTWLVKMRRGKSLRKIMVRRC